VSLARLWQRGAGCRGRRPQPPCAGRGQFQPAPQWPYQQLNQSGQHLAPLNQSEAFVVPLWNHLGERVAQAARAGPRRPGLPGGPPSAARQPLNRHGRNNAEYLGTQVTFKSAK